jgi:hypothetical protein
MTVVLAGLARKSLKPTSIDRSARISVILNLKSRVGIWDTPPEAQGRFMKEVIALLLVAVMLTSCGSNRTVTSTAGGTWEAQLVGGAGEASGFSFTTAFTVNSNGSLNLSTFEFLTDNTPGCFPVSIGDAVNGTMPLVLQSNDTVTGTLTFIVQANGNTLTLNGTVTGTATVTGNEGNNSTTLTSATATGTWTLTGASGCSNGTGSFTMVSPT